VALSDGMDVILAVPEFEPDDEGLAPRERVAVGDIEMERERLRVEVGVDEDVDVLDAVAEPVGVTEGETEVAKLLGVAEALAPNDREAVGVPD
jgi:hypothetical protein